MVTLRSIQKMQKNLCLQTFIWGLGLAFLIFFPWMLYNYGYFFFYGDFNVQQIPFYQMIHDSIQNGNIGWSYTTDLGANIIGSYSFYMIGSPFFWLTMLFPSDVVPYLMAPLLMLKFALAAMCAYLFLRRYVREQRFAMFGALIYAFSGFGVYNIFFNHFHEAMITFPLMLAAIDMFIYDNRKGFVAASVFLAAAVNYYFFAGQAIFIFIYWCYRMATKSYKMKLIDFVRFAFEIIVGFLCAGILIIPSIHAVLQNSRLNNYPYGWNAIVYSSEQRYVHILESFFFPPDMPAYSNFTPDSNAKWGSVAAWLPLFSMTGVFAFYSLKTSKWLKKFIVILFIIAFVPAFNSVFQLLNFSYYARWFYMLTLMLSLATIMCLDREETNFKPALLKTYLITAVITIMIGFMPEDSWTDPKSKHELGLEKYTDRFWAWVAIAFVGLAALTIVLCLRKNKKLFIRTTSIVLSVLIVLYANVLVGVGVLNATYKYEKIAEDTLNVKGKFDEELKDLHQVRSDFYNDMDNMGMYWQIPTIQAFQSIVPGSVMDFYNCIGVERTVGSRPDNDVYAVRGLLSVKYLFDYNDKDDFEKTKKSKNTAELPGWNFMMEKYNYKVYENEYYIPYGFTYDEYITTKQFDDITESDRHLALMKALVLTDEQAKKYKGIIKHHLSTKDYEFTEKKYYDDCIDRRKNVCSNITFENNKFTATFKSADKQDKLVFFSIPYEKGWSAKVNGEPVEIEKVNIGFMAVRVPGDTVCEIVFRYSTPGLELGAVVSGAGIVLFIAYMYLWKAPVRKREISMCFIEDDEEAYAVDYYNQELFELYEDDVKDSEETTSEMIDSEDNKELSEKDTDEQPTAATIETSEIKENISDTEKTEMDNTEVKTDKDISNEKTEDQPSAETENTSETKENVSETQNAEKESSEVKNDGNKRNRISKE